VQSFDWADFYAHWAGGGFFNWLRAELRAATDAVLIDARTGVTEMGGIATHQMADAIVMLFGANEENMTSSARMATSFLSEETTKSRDGQSLPVLAVPSRVDKYDSVEYGDFLSRLDSSFASLLPAQLGDSFGVVEMLLPYLPLLSYRESLVIGDERLERSAAEIAEGYRKVASNMQLLAPAGSTIATGSVATVPARVYLASAKHQVDIAGQVRKILTDAGTDVQPPPSFAQTVDDSALASAACVLVLVDEQSEKSRQASSVVSLAMQYGKPTIPVLTKRDAVLPHLLADIVPLRWYDDQRRPETLLAAIGAHVAQLAYLSIPEQTATSGTPSVFMSYDANDTAAAEQVTTMLRTLGLDVWFDQEQLKPGEQFATSVRNALEQASAVVAIVSPGEPSRSTARDLTYAESLKKPIFPLVIGDTDTAFPWGVTSTDFAHLADGIDEAGVRDFAEQLMRGLEA
jgi:hypothetical protein